MAWQASVLYDDGSVDSKKYRLAHLARWFKAKYGPTRIKSIKKKPIFPHILRMALSDARTTAVGRKVAGITIEEGVI